MSSQELRDELQKMSERLRECRHDGWVGWVADMLIELEIQLRTAAVKMDK